MSNTENKYYFSASQVMNANPDNFIVVGDKNDVKNAFQEFAELLTNNKAVVYHNLEVSNLESTINNNNLELYQRAVILDTQEYNYEDIRKITDRCNEYSVPVMISARDEEHSKELQKHIDISYTWPKEGPEWQFFNLCSK